MQAYSVDGIRYDIIGDGTPLVLVHGGSGRRQWFDPMTPLLERDARMLRVDLPGHGDSAPTPGHYRLEESAAALHRVLDHAGWERCVVFGHSHGAHVAAVLAADHPDRVAGLVIGDAPFDRERMRAHHRATAPMNRAWRALTGAARPQAHTLAGFLALEIAGPGSPSIEDVFGREHPYVREMVASLRHHDGDFLDAVLDRFDDTYHRLDDALLRAVTCPVVLLAADPAAGGLVGDADIAYVTDRAAGARVHGLSGVGHGLQLQDPRQVAEALRDHLRPAR